MSGFEKRLTEALRSDIPEVPDEEPIWNVMKYIKDLEERDPRVERILLSSEVPSLFAAFEYAKKLFKGVGWPELEERIKHDSWLAYKYAKEVLGGPFPPGEPAIYRSDYFTRKYNDLLEWLANHE